MTYYILPLLLAFGLAYFLTMAVRVLAFKVGAVDHPNARKVHSGVMPRMGGLAVFLAFALVTLLFREVTQQVWGLLAGALVILCAGIVDDIRELSPKAKLVAQIIAVLVIIPFGIQVHFITNPLNGEMIYLGLFSIPVTIFWVVAVTNAVNLIDGLDGLASGVSCIAVLTMATVTWVQFGASGKESIMLALTLAAALIGFLRHNFFPAKIFLGDTGSMFLGFALAVMAITGVTKSAAAVSVIIPLVILGVPLLDTFFAVIRRYNEHKPIFQPDKAHLHHRLMALGLSHKQTVLVIYGISIVLGFSAIVLNIISSSQAIIMLILLVVAVIYLADRIGILGKSRHTNYNLTTEEYKQRSSKM